MEKTDYDLRMENRLAAIKAAPESFMAAFRIVDAVGYLAYASGGFLLEEGSPGRFANAFAEWGEWTRAMKLRLDSGDTATFPQPPVIPMALGVYETVITKAYADAGLVMRMAS